MDKVFSAYIYNKKHYARSTELFLPATPYQMLDALDKVRLQEGDKLCVEVENFCDLSILTNSLDDPELNALNALAQRLSEMDEGEMTRFAGLVRIDAAQQKGDIPLSRLIDLAHSVGRCTFAPGVTDDSELGGVLAENDLIPEIKDVPDTAFELLDFALLGRRVREKDGGVFVPAGGDRGGGYVALDGEVQEVYHTLDLTLREPTYAIQLELRGGAGFTNLNLPATPQEMDAALDYLEVSGWDEVCHRCVDCRAPALIPHIGERDNIAHLNRLAGRLAAMDAPTLVKFKAVLDATEDFSVLGATHIADTLRDYLYEPKYANPEDMAQDFLRCSMGVAAISLEPYVNLMGYGQKLLEEQQGAMTDYGMVSREDGQNLKTSLTPTAPTQRGMEGMSM